MRLSEKTIEINFCAQLSHTVHGPVWWFGLTQAQEATAGWDVAGQVAGRWLRFQLKASNRLLSTGARRFQAKHAQLDDLRDRAPVPGRVFYALPMIGTTAELTAVKFNLLASMRLVDVNDLHGVGPPTKASGALRKSESHYVDLHPSGAYVVFHSEPVIAPTVDTREFGGYLERTAQTADEEAAEGVELSRDFLANGRNRVALFLPAG